MQAPNPYITIDVDGKEREIFMSFGLLDTLCRIIGDPANVAQVHVNFELREQILKETLAERKKSGKLVKHIDVDELDISVEDVEELVSWVAEHVLAFFIRSLSKVAEVTKRSEGQIKDLVSSFPGLNDSASKTESSGQPA